MRLVLSAFVLFNCASFARRVSYDLNLRGRDDVTLADDAFRRMLPFLPERGTVGYLKSDFTRSNAADLAAFFQAQFAIAPRILVNGTDADFVIAATRGGGDLPTAPPGFVLEQTFTGRLALLRRVR
jgi:hypothetical protein